MVASPGQRWPTNMLAIFEWACSARPTKLEPAILTKEPTMTVPHAVE